MAKKKTAKKTGMKKAPACAPNQSCHCSGFFALLIILFTWWKPTETWANIVITVLAAIILLSGNSCFCKK